MKRAPFVLLLAVLVAGLVSSSRAPASARSPSAAQGGLIVYQSYSDSGKRSGGLYLIESDGRGDRRISHQPVESVGPRWSPDGRQIAFLSVKSGIPSLYVIKPGGSGLRRLLEGTAASSPGYPAWSPDGRSIAFVRGKPCSTTGLCKSRVSILSLASGKISDVANTSTALFTISWSPDGKAIALARDKPLGLWRVNVNGSSPKRLTKGTDGFPAWSPDGKSIAFTRIKNGGTVIWFVDPKSGTFSYFGHPAGSFSGPSWSPDGSTLVLSKGAAGDGDICTMSASTGKSSCLAHTPGIDDTLPDWQPASK